MGDVAGVTGGSGVLGGVWVGGDGVAGLGVSGAPTLTPEVVAVANSAPPRRYDVGEVRSPTTAVSTNFAMACTSTTTAVSTANSDTTLNVPVSAVVSALRSLPIAGQTVAFFRIASVNTNVPSTKHRRLNVTWLMI